MHLTVKQIFQMMNHTPCGRKMRRKMPVQFILSTVSHGRDHIPLGNHFPRKLLQAEQEGSGLTLREVRWQGPRGWGSNMGVLAHTCCVAESGDRHREVEEIPSPGAPRVEVRAGSRRARVLTLRQ